MKKVLSVLLVLLILLATVGSLADNAPVIHDDAELLSEDEESELAQAMEPLCKFGIPVFWTTNQEDSTDTLTKAEDYLVKMVGDKEGVAFVIDMYNRELVICSTSHIYQYVTTTQANLILNNVYKMATAGDYLECAQATYAAILEVLEKSGLSENHRESNTGILNYKILSDDELLNMIAEATAELQSRRADNQSDSGKDHQSYTYTAIGSLYLIISNPNIVSYDDSNPDYLNELYIAAADVEKKLKSDNVLSAVLEKLDSDNNMIDLLPEASVEYLRSIIFIEPFAPAPRIIEVKCTTNDPVLSANICNCLIEIGPSEYTKSGGSGELMALYYAEIPEQPDLEYSN